MIGRNDGMGSGEKGKSLYDSGNRDIKKEVTGETMSLCILNSCNVAS